MCAWSNDEWVGKGWKGKALRGQMRDEHKKDSIFTVGVQHGIEHSEVGRRAGVGLHVHTPYLRVEVIGLQGAGDAEVLNLFARTYEQEMSRWATKKDSRQGRAGPDQ
jgi:hypothetical protein